MNDLACYIRCGQDLPSTHDWLKSYSNLIALLLLLALCFTLRELKVYKPNGCFLGFLATFTCFCVTVLFYRYLHFVVKKK